MKVEYKKDLRHNYMVIEKDETANPEQYCIRILENQSIQGILPFEQRRLDNKVFYYYEITAKQSMANILDKTVLSYDSIKQLFHGILDVLEIAYEYLLPEDDFVLSPEHIYREVVTNKPMLCFLPGFATDIKKQINILLEFLMNKVDYNEKEAVLLVYQLYAVSREEEFTFEQLTNILHSDHQKNSKEYTSPRRIKINCNLDEPEIELDHKKDTYRSHEKNITKGKDAIHLKAPVVLEDNNTNVPVMKEKIEGETEATFYPVQNLILSGICILSGILTVTLSLTTGILYNSFGNRIDYTKLLALLLIVLCVEGYFLKKLLDKKNKITKMVQICEYVDPRKDFLSSGVKLQSKVKASKSDTLIRPNEISCQTMDPIIGIRDEISDQNELKPQLDTCKQDKVPMKNIPMKSTDEEEEDNPTCLLNSISEQNTLLILKALDETNYKNITISSFPFFIGKLKKNVDYCLEKDVVSRYHAKIICENEIYYIIDLNSTNGTYINGEPLMTYQRMEIKSGDEITFANIKYKLII